MSTTPPEPERLLASLLDDEQVAGPLPADDPAERADDDVESLIDALEAVIAEGRRMPFHRMIVDEERLLGIVDRLRMAIPAEVRQAHQLLDRHDDIIEAAQSKARQIMEERGMYEAIEAERRRTLDEADREAQRIRGEADRYARAVLLDLDERLGKLQVSVRNGIEALDDE